MTTLKIFHLALILAISSSLAQSQAIANSRKLDDTTPSDNKCGGCPCNNPCNPPPSPSPPPPPSTKKPPPSNYCPPPPSGGQFGPSPPYIFVNGPPQDLYPTDNNFSGSGRIFSVCPIPFLISWVVGMIIAFMW